MEASAGVTLRPGHIHDEEEHKGAEEHTEEEEHGHDHGQFDPHVWLSPVNAKKEMENIKNAYVKADPENKDYYEKIIRPIQPSLINWIRNIKIRCLPCLIRAL